MSQHHELASNKQIQSDIEESFPSRRESLGYAAAALCGVFLTSCGEPKSVDIVEVKLGIDVKVKFSASNDVQSFQLEDLKLGHYTAQLISPVELHRPELIDEWSFEAKIDGEDVQLTPNSSYSVTYGVLVISHSSESNGLRSSVIHFDGSGRSVYERRGR